MPIGLILTTVVSPLVGAMIALGAVLAIGKARKRPMSAWSGAAGPICLAAAFAVGAPGVFGRVPPFPPTLGEEWTPYLVLIGALGGIACAGLTGGPRWAQVLASFAVAAGMSLAASLTALANAAPRMGDMRPAWVGGAALGVGVTAALSAWGAGGWRRDRDPDKDPGAGGFAGTPVAWGVLIGASAVAIVLSGSAKLAQLTGLLGLGLLPPAIAALFVGVRWKRAWSMGPGTAVALAPALSILLWLAYWYAEAPLSCAVIGTLAPACVSAARLPGLARRALPAGAVQTALALVAGGAIVALAVQARQARLGEPTNGLRDLYSVAPAAKPPEPRSGPEKRSKSAVERWTVRHRELRSLMAPA